MHQLPFKLAGIASLICATHVVWADVPGLPGSVQPGVLGRELQTQQPSASSQVLPPVVRNQEKAASPLAKEAQKIKFKLNGIVLKGNHVFSEAQLQPVYANDLHKTITVLELFNIVQHITNYYRNSGYILSRAILPPQHVKDGIVTVEVIEGSIANVDVIGKPNNARCLVQAFGNKIMECPPLQLSRLERNLLLMNEIPGTQVRAVLKPSKNKTGAADLSLVTINTPITGYVSYDDYGTRYIGPQQISANLGLNSYLFSGDALNFTVTKTPRGGELTYNDVNYNFPIDANGERWLVGYTRVHTFPLFVLQPAHIDGLNDNYYTTIYYPIIRTRSDSLTLRTGFNYLDSQVHTFEETLYTDHIRSLDIGATYNFADSWKGSNSISGDVRQGLPILGYTSNQNPDTAQTSRPGGRGDYSKLTMQLSRLQGLPWHFSLYGVFQGQTACNPLLASEQFTFGGSQLGRGYDVAEIIGDKGLAGSVELRYDLGINRFYLQNLQFYTFYDIGAVWNFKYVGGTPRKQDGTSTGFGARFFLTKFVSGNVMWTQTLTRPVAAETFIHQGRRPRVFFSVVASLGVVPNVDVPRTSNGTSTFRLGGLTFRFI